MNLKAGKTEFINTTNEAVIIDEVNETNEY